jgi:transcriptional regulator with XRE-family HTH domain
MTGMAAKDINTELNKAIAEKLHRVRTRANELQYSVAQKLNVSETTYSKLENGKVDFTATRLKQIAAHFQVNVSDFLDENIEVPRLLKDLTSPADYKALEAKYELLRELYEEARSTK